MTNKEIAEAFRAAKPFLSQGDAIGGKPFICNALATACDKGLISNEGRVAATSVIMFRLQGFPTVISWLRIRRNIDTATYLERQQYRHRWLDALIEEFDK